MKKLKKIILLSVMTFVALYLVGSTINYLKMSKLVVDMEYFKAYKSNIEWLLDFGRFNRNKTIKFYDIMANHYILDDGTKEEWVIPDLTGWSCAEISYALENINQPYEIEYIDDYDYDYNSVIKTEPSAGDIITAKDTVKLFVNSLFTNNLKSATALEMSTAVEGGKWVYFTNSNIIYKCTIDLSQKKEIYKKPIEDYLIYKIMCREDKLYIYMKDRINNEGLIVEYNTSDNNEKVLAKGDIHFAYLIADNIILFKSDQFGEFQNVAINVNDNSIKIVPLTSQYRMNKKNYYYMKARPDLGSLCKSSSILGDNEFEEINDEDIVAFILVNNEIYLHSYDYEQNKISILPENNIIYENESNTYYSVGFMKWQNNVIIIDDTIDMCYMAIYNTETETYSRISVPEEITIDIFYAIEKHIIGNYIYFYDSFEEMGGYRYNLITGEFENY